MERHSRYREADDPLSTDDSQDYSEPLLPSPSDAGACDKPKVMFFKPNVPTAQPKMISALNVKLKPNVMTYSPKVTIPKSSPAGSLDLPMGAEARDYRPWRQRSGSGSSSSLRQVPWRRYLKKAVRSVLDSMPSSSSEAASSGSGSSYRDMLSSLMKEDVKYELNDRCDEALVRHMKEATIVRMKSDSTGGESSYEGAVEGAVGGVCAHEEAVGSECAFEGAIAGADEGAVGGAGAFKAAVGGAGASEGAVGGVGVCEGAVGASERAFGGADEGAILGAGAFEGGVGSASAFEDAVGVEIEFHGVIGVDVSEDEVGDGGASESAVGGAFGEEDEEWDESSDVSDSMIEALKQIMKEQMEVEAEDLQMVREVKEVVKTSVENESNESACNEAIVEDVKAIMMAKISGQIDDFMDRKIEQHSLSLQKYLPPSRRRTSEKSSEESSHKESKETKSSEESNKTDNTQSGVIKSLKSGYVTDDEASTGDTYEGAVGGADEGAGGGARAYEGLVGGAGILAGVGVGAIAVEDWEECTSVSWSDSSDDSEAQDADGHTKPTISDDDAIAKKISRELTQLLGSSRHVSLMAGNIEHLLGRARRNASIECFLEMKALCKRSQLWSLEVITEISKAIADNEHEVENLKAQTNIPPSGTGIFDYQMATHEASHCQHLIAKTQTTIEMLKLQSDVVTEYFEDIEALCRRFDI